MKLILIQDTNGGELEICQCPSSLLSSRTGLANFLRLRAGRVFGGREGRDWKVCADEKCLVPLCVNQLVPYGPGGQMDYGQQLVVK